MVKRLFSTLFISKSKKFANVLTYMGRDCVIPEVDMDGGWFVATVHYKFDEIRSTEGASAPNLVLVRRKDLREVADMKPVVNWKARKYYS